MKLAATRSELEVVNDQRGCPTYARDLARAILCRANAEGTSVSLDGKGYNLYRWDPSGSCMKINEQLIEHTFYEDCFVEPGKTYRYAATALKQNCESDPSNVVEVSIPQP